MVIELVDDEPQEPINAIFDDEDEPEGQYEDEDPNFGKGNETPEPSKDAADEDAAEREYLIELEGIDRELMATETEKSDSMNLELLS